MTHAVPRKPAEPEVLELLTAGKLSVEGRLVDASNATLYCRVEAEGHSRMCIYKPRLGERPLWDFPTGTLGTREVAAHVISEALEWQIVPPTVWRDGPFGPGMVQLWIDVDETVDLVQLVRSSRLDLQRIAVFDIVINNADRKGGHLLPTSDGHLYGIDHGVTFAVDDKLRTLLWQWVGRPIPADLLHDLSALQRRMQQTSADLSRTLRRLLTADEMVALDNRFTRLIRSGCYPSPSPDWPAIPWPPF